MDHHPHNDKDERGMSELGKIGDRVIYVVVQFHAGDWAETDCPASGTLDQALDAMRMRSRQDPSSTYAVVSRIGNPPPPIRTYTPV